MRWKSKWDRDMKRVGKRKTCLRFALFPTDYWNGVLWLEFYWLEKEFGSHFCWEVKQVLLKEDKDRSTP